MRQHLFAIFAGRAWIIVRIRPFSVPWLSGPSGKIAAHNNDNLLRPVQTDWARHPQSAAPSVAAAAPYPDWDERKFPRLLGPPIKSGGPAVS